MRTPPRLPLLLLPLAVVGLALAQDEDPEAAGEDELRTLCDPIDAHSALDADGRERFRRLYRIAQSSDVRSIDPDALARGAANPDPNYRNCVAQIALRFAAAGGALPVDTLARFMADPELQIRSYSLKTQDGSRTWGELLSARLKYARCNGAEIASVGSATRHADPEIRARAYEALTAPALAPGREAFLLLGLTDSQESTRERCAGWFAELEPETKLEIPAREHEISAVVHALMDSNPSVQAAGRRCLLALDEGGRACLRRLAEAGPNEAFRKAARDALRD